MFERFFKNKDCYNTKRAPLDEIINSVNNILEDKEGLKLIRTSFGYGREKYTVKCTKCHKKILYLEEGMSKKRLDNSLQELKEYECTSCEDILDKLNKDKMKWVKYEKDFIEKVKVGSRVRIRPRRIYSNTKERSYCGELEVIEGRIIGYTDEDKDGFMNESLNYEYTDEGIVYEYRISNFKPIIISDKGLEEIVIDCIGNIELIDEITKDEKDYIIKLLTEEGLRKYDDKVTLARNRKIIDKLNLSKK
ncbi:hypothetical protein UT300012_31690 [Paraclostridium bifermentans]